MRPIDVSYLRADGHTSKLQVRLDVGPGYRDSCDVCVASMNYAHQAFLLMNEICIFSLEKPDTKKIPKTPVIVVPSYSAADVVKAYASRFKDVLEQAHIEKIGLVLPGPEDDSRYIRVIEVKDL